MTASERTVVALAPGGKPPSGGFNGARALPLVGRLFRAGAPATVLERDPGPRADSRAGAGPGEHTTQSTLSFTAG
jgi:hypothetical protein